MILHTNRVKREPKATDVLGGTEAALLRESPHARLRLACACIALAGWLACGSPELTQVPPFLRGDWTTDAPRYQGRTLQIRANEVVFRGPQGVVDRYSIQAVEPQSDEGAQRFKLRYRDLEGNVDWIQLQFDPQVNALRLGSRADRWTR